VPQLAVHGPFDERDLNDNFWTHPVRAQSGQSLGGRKRRFGELDRVEATAQIQQQLRVEAGAEFTGIDEASSS